MHDVSEKLCPLREIIGGFRFSANRFVFLVQGSAGRSELIELAEQIRGRLEEGLDPIGHHIEVGIGTGSHREPVDVAAAVQHLETSRGAPSYAFFDVEMEARLRREEIIAQDLRRFMANPSLGTVHLHYQPKVAAASQEVVGFEALSRLSSPSLGLISPGEFIPIAERQGLIVPLGYWVRLNARDHTDLHVGVNISVLQLLQAGFVQQAGEIIEAAGIEPSQLQLEITESLQQALGGGRSLG
ncbi:EAL domain-containing protein [Candidatus Darwinibacter acetoxidans]